MNFVILVDLFAEAVSVGESNNEGKSVLETGFSYKK